MFTDNILKKLKIDANNDVTHTELNNSCSVAHSYINENDEINKQFSVEEVQSCKYDY